MLRKLSVLLRIAGLDHEAVETNQRFEEQLNGLTEAQADLTAAGEAVDKLIARWQPRTERPSAP